VIKQRVRPSSGRTAAAALTASFGLTPREAEPTELLARDITLTHAADTLDISRKNARAHLKQVFSKTNTSRQTELVSVILRSQVQNPRRERKASEDA
jgi:DNA-binding CsgD family transcriptional regulator